MGSVGENSERSKHMNKHAASAMGSLESRSDAAISADNPQAITTGGVVGEYWAGETFAHLEREVNGMAEETGSLRGYDLATTTTGADMMPQTQAEPQPKHA